MIAVSLVLLWRLTLSDAGAVAATPRGSSARPDAPLPDHPLPLTGVAIKGSPKAKVAIIEFSDFECSYCGRFARETLPEIDRRYISTGQVLLAFKHLPIERIHRNAVNAAVSAECAGLDGKFWEMHDRLFQHQSLLDPKSLYVHAQAIGLDAARFARCLDTDFAPKIRSEGSQARELKVSATPTFLIGVVENAGVRVRHRLTGALPLQDFVEVLENLLRSR
jgi:protein-disulfide isomerase